MLIATVGPALLEVADKLLEGGITKSEAVSLMLTAMYIRSLEKTGGNLCRSARQLEAHRNTVLRDLEGLGLVGLAHEIRKQKKIQLLLPLKKFPAGVGRPPRRGVA